MKSTNLSTAKKIDRLYLAWSTCPTCAQDVHKWLSSAQQAKKCMERRRKEESGKACVCKFALHTAHFIHPPYRQLHHHSRSSSMPNSLYYSAAYTDYTRDTHTLTFSKEFFKKSEEAATEQQHTTQLFFFLLFSSSLLHRFYFLLSLHITTTTTYTTTESLSLAFLLTYFFALLYQLILLFSTSLFLLLTIHNTCHHPPPLYIDT